MNTPPPPHFGARRGRPPDGEVLAQGEKAALDRLRRSPYHRLVANVVRETAWLTCFGGDEDEDEDGYLGDLVQAVEDTITFDVGFDEFLRGRKKR